ncbi:MAG TPA: NAD(P)-dependent oxidoreductase [Bryobacteraceae bacterium]|nr:NAD(P)-dependent oxidoreductase [Bryobacteraceae bacterium]
MILVTGAQGFLGRAVCAALGRAGLPFAGTDVETCDLTDAAAVAQVFRAGGIDTVIHLAALLATASEADPVRAMRVHAAGSANLFEAAAGTGTKRVVYASSMSVYGAVGSGAALDERAPAAPDSVYGASKRYVEICGAAAAKRAGFRFTALRIASLVGPGVRNTASPWRSEIFEKLGTGSAQSIALPFAPETVLSMVHVEDAARMLLAAAACDRVPETVYNSPAENWTASRLARAIEDADPRVKVQLERESPRGAPPVADGARFQRDFGFKARGLAERLQRAARRDGHISARPSPER